MMRWMFLGLVMLGCSADAGEETTATVEQDPGQCVCDYGSCYYENTGDACCICPIGYECALDSRNRFYCLGE